MISKFLSNPGIPVRICTDSQGVLKMGNYCLCSVLLVAFCFVLFCLSEFHRSKIMLVRYPQYFATRTGTPMQTTGKPVTTGGGNFR